MRTGKEVGGKDKGEFDRIFLGIFGKGKCDSFVGGDEQAKNGEYPITNTQYPIMKDGLLLRESGAESSFDFWVGESEPLTRHFVPPSPKGEG